MEILNLREAFTIMLGKSLFLTSMSIHSFSFDLLTSKVLFIGIDSADYNQIKRLCSCNELPNIRKFENCFLGRLQSTIPPHTAASWTSMLTGTNPGKHGIFYFRDVVTDKLVSSLDVSVPYVWELLGSSNKQSIVVNVPLTYPVRRIKGIMISGIHADKPERNSVYPESLIPKVARDYKFDLQGINLFYGFSKDPPTTCSRLLDDEESRVSFFCKLLEENLWDFGCIILTSLDRIQHNAWQLKSRTEAISHYVTDAYHRVDELVGRIIETVSDFQDCVTILGSDHGFQNKSGTVYVNTILANAGLLTPKHTTDKFEERITKFGLKTLGPRVPRKFASLLIRIANQLTPLYPGLLSGSHRFDVPPIDYSRTMAYAYSYGLVVVNLKGRKREGIVDPSDREKVVERVERALSNASLGHDKNMKLKPIKATDYYGGSEIAKAPDLVLEPLDGYYFSCAVKLNCIDSETKGEHSVSGIIGAIGKDLNSTTELASPKVWDVGASILFLLGFEIPRELDGKPLFGSKDPMKLQNVVMYDDGKSIQDSTSAYSREEEEDIARKLKDMGYE